MQADAAPGGPLLSDFGVSATLKPASGTPATAAVTVYLSPTPPRASGTAGSVKSSGRSDMPVMHNAERRLAWIPALGDAEAISGGAIVGANGGLKVLVAGDKLVVNKRDIGILEDGTREVEVSGKVYLSRGKWMFEVKQ